MENRRPPLSEQEISRRLCIFGANPKLHIAPHPCCRVLGSLLISHLNATARIGRTFIAAAISASCLLLPSTALAFESEDTANANTQFTKEAKVSKNGIGVSPSDATEDESFSIAHIINEAATYAIAVTPETATLAKRLEDAEHVVSDALEHVGARYVSGGMSPGGFDCSGLVKHAFATALGMDLPRTTYGQVTLGEEIALESAEKGDLVFWGSRSAPYHVGICLGEGQYVHAANHGKGVRLDTFDSYAPSFAKRIL